MRLSMPMPEFYDFPLEHSELCLPAAMEGASCLPRAGLQRFLAHPASPATIPSPPHLSPQQPAEPLQHQLHPPLTTSQSQTTARQKTQGGGHVAVRQQPLRWGSRLQQGWCWLQDCPGLRRWTPAGGVACHRTERDGSGLAGGRWKQRPAPSAPQLKADSGAGTPESQRGGPCSRQWSL